MQYTLIPGILEQEFPEIKKKLQLMSPLSKKIHIDVIDGKFANNHTWMDPQPFKTYAPEHELEVHLMVENPLQYVESFARAGFLKFIGHVEKMPDIAEFIAVTQQYGQVGLALDSETPLSVYDSISFEDIDFAFLMTVKAGHSDQTFLPQSLEKIRSLREKVSWLPIEVDGGMNTETIVAAKDAGATDFVVTHAIFGEVDPQNAFTDLNELLQQ